MTTSSEAFENIVLNGFKNTQERRLLDWIQRKPSEGHKVFQAGAVLPGAHAVPRAPASLPSAWRPHAQVQI